MRKTLDLALILYDGEFTDIVRFVDDNQVVVMTLYNGGPGYAPQSVTKTKREGTIDQYMDIARRCLSNPRIVYRRDK
jgi:hypothetical protein